MYAQTSVAADRSSLKTSMSLPVSMRPAIEDSSDRGVAVAKVSPWSSAD